MWAPWAGFVLVTSPGGSDTVDFASALSPGSKQGKVSPSLSWLRGSLRRQKSSAPAPSFLSPVGG